ncbi:MAG: rhodanese-like domain-containing protein [Cyanobacteria bacterium]|nr:rhodanese-like domain-containing protein [Cyanobacteria bacterium CG_2015-16_32_12]NCO77164.1 rhodanese-like domain-containing protein [Cyanobacteria bacterium CG_2015-22_32_23]NCQ04379.1 rhodanese-like domain-containing protein [Cyanobacteria bacterium CG_2015-09_32_10]NCQ41017.1 rhodanese-like domain-containing protein [Cyanobacteria bacterium CG_2015-04_32_10]
MNQTLLETRIKLINPQELMEKLIKESVFLVDVREEEEYNFGHICTAILKPSSQFHPEEWLHHHNIILYCRSGKRSHQIAEKLIALGITSVTELEGGIIAWQKANFPLVK